jgi:hypothetical protein
MFIISLALFFLLFAAAGVIADTASGIKSEEAPNAEKRKKFLREILIVYI